MSLFWERLKELDAYPKPLEDFRIKTLGGGTLTIISSLIMFALFISELSDYLSPKITEELFVDTSRSNKLKITLDITFPRVACSYLSMDAMDSSGEQQSSLEHNIFKRRLDDRGDPIPDAAENPIDIGETKKDANKTEEKKPESENKEKSEIALEEKPKCGSCYGAESDRVKCCSTCEDVRDAYRLKGWAFKNAEGIEQCKGMAEELNKIFNEGCRVYGSMEVNRVSGSFHVAPGKSFSINHIHVHDVQPYSSSQFNMSHVINTLTFGTNIPGKTDPIDGIEGIATEESMMFQYYLKIVPLTYDEGPKTILTNQFSTTRHQKVVSSSSGESGMPGVFFSYEISPIMIKYSQKSKSFGHFATGVCAIIGGVFTVAGIIDTTIYKSAKMIKKLELGKLG